MIAPVNQRPRVFQLQAAGPNQKVRVHQLAAVSLQASAEAYQVLRVLLVLKVDQSVKAVLLHRARRLLSVLLQVWLILGAEASALRREALLQIAQVNLRRQQKL